MDSLPLIEQHSSSSLKSSPVLEEEGKPTRECEWIYERGENKGSKCNRGVYSAAKYCTFHRANLEKRKKAPAYQPKLEAAAEKEEAFFEEESEPEPAELDSFPDAHALSAPDSALVDDARLAALLMGDQQIVEILHGIVMMRLKIAGLLPKRN